MNTDLTWSNSSIHDEIRELGLDRVNRPTPETNKLADTLHRDETPLVIRYHKMMMNSQRLELERDEAREQRDRMAAVLQRIRDGYGGQVASPNCCADCDFLLPIDEALQFLTTNEP